MTTVYLLARQDILKGKNNQIGLDFSPFKPLHSNTVGYRFEKDYNKTDIVNIKKGIIKHRPAFRSVDKCTKKNGSTYRQMYIKDWAYM
jgi:hypothetical protein